MRAALVVLLILTACRTAAPMQPFLVALSTPDVDRAVQWYRDKLDFTLVSRNEFPDYGMTIAIVARDEFRLELVQVRGSVTPESVVPDYANPASLHGYGKIAFSVDDASGWAAPTRTRRRLSDRADRESRGQEDDVHRAGRRRELDSVQGAVKPPPYSHCANPPHHPDRWLAERKQSKA